MKKTIALVLVAVMALGLFAALAEGIPSKTTADMANVLSYENTGDPIKDDFAIVVNPDSEAAAAELEALIAFVNGGNAPKDYFGEGLLPADVDELELLELVGISAENYDPAYGDVTAQFQFGTSYGADQEVYPLLKADGWQNADGAVQEDGTVKITFTQDQLTKLAGGEAVLTVLNTPAE